MDSDKALAQRNVQRVHCFSTAYWSKDGCGLRPQNPQGICLIFKLLYKQYHNATKITVVQDNLSTHSPASFYKVFKPSEAFALAQKFSMHYTPKKASWLNMVEIELKALSKQCLDRRIGERHTLQREVKAWVEKRNLKGITVKWQFTKDKAREKFARFYPNIS